MSKPKIIVVEDDSTHQDNWRKILSLLEEEFDFQVLPVLPEEHGMLLVETVSNGGFLVLDKQGIENSKKVDGLSIYCAAKTLGFDDFVAMASNIERRDYPNVFNLGKPGNEDFSGMLATFLRKKKLFIGTYYTDEKPKPWDVQKTADQQKILDENPDVAYIYNKLLAYTS